MDSKLFVTTSSVLNRTVSVNLVKRVITYMMIVAVTSWILGCGESEPPPSQVVGVTASPSTADSQHADADHVISPTSSSSAQGGTADAATSVHQSMTAAKTEEPKRLSLRQDAEQSAILRPDWQRPTLSGQLDSEVAYKVSLLDAEKRHFRVEMNVTVSMDLVDLGIELKPSPNGRAVGGDTHYYAATYQDGESVAMQVDMHFPMEEASLLIKVSGQHQGMLKVSRTYVTLAQLGQ